jgi:hypothetical protein
MKSICLWLGILIAASEVSWGETAPPAQRISGIYSDLAFNNEGGDLLGIELMIVPRESKADLAWSVFVQIAEGGAPQIGLVPLTLVGDKIEFTLPPAGASGGMHFSGTISSTEIRLNTPSGPVEVLHRGKSYWQGH